MGHMPLPCRPCARAHASGCQSLAPAAGDQQPEPVERLRPEVPRAVAAVVRKLMAKQPEQRFQTPAELIQALDGLRSGRLENGTLAAWERDGAAPASLPARRPARDSGTVVNEPSNGTVRETVKVAA